MTTVTVPTEDAIETPVTVFDADPDSVGVPTALAIAVPDGLMLAVPVSEGVPTLPTTAVPVTVMLPPAEIETVPTELVTVVPVEETFAAPFIEGEPAEDASAFPVTLTEILVTVVTVAVPTALVRDVPEGLTETSINSRRSAPVPFSSRNLLVPSSSTRYPLGTFIYRVRLGYTLLQTLKEL